MIARLLAIFRGASQLWIIAGITLLLLLLVDQLLRAMLPDPAAWAVVDPAARAPDRERAQAVAQQDWIGDYWREHAQSKDSEWRSYVYWHRRPYTGTLIRIDAHGFRVTPTPAAFQRTIWLFGGSVVWGTGNRDTGTLAAQLQQVYAERAPELGVRVLNFGESGYVSRQSLLSFQLALACPQPAADLAIFVDGANDVYASLQSERAGLPQNESNRVLEFNSARDPGRQLAAWARQLQGINRLVAQSTPELTADRIASLATDSAREYLSNVRQARALGLAYGVDVIAGWQPTLFDRAQARGDEAAIVGASAARHLALQQATRQAASAQLKSTLGESVFDLGDVFDQSEAPMYFDFVHLSEAGQRLLAERLFAISVDRIGGRPVVTADARLCVDRPVGG